MIRSRRGFTLIELVVALTLVAVGVAAWATTSVVALRLAGEADREQAAVEDAATRAERLAASGCAAIADGADGAARWTVTWILPTMRHVRVEHAYPGPDTIRVAVAERLVTC